jgi:hypothetical protein
MKRALLVTIVILLAGLVWAQAAEPDTEEKGITGAALGYMDGALDGDATRIARAVHPELCKVTPMTLPQTGRTALRRAGNTRLVELVRANLINLEEEKRNIEVEIFDHRLGLASVKVVSSMFYDYLHLAKIDGEWSILNVLWVEAPRQEPQPDALAKDEAAIRAAVLDYIEGYFTGDAKRMQVALHPELNKVTPYQLPQTGKTMIDKIGAGLLIEYTRTKGGLLDESKRQLEVTVYDVNGNIATAGVMSAMFYDYLQLAKIDGRWQIVNVLWKMNPDAPKPDKG